MATLALLTASPFRGGATGGAALKRAGAPLASAAAPPPLEVYSTPGCTYCARAKRFLKRYSLPFLERDVSASEDDLKQMMLRAGSSTLPQIFVGGEHVGGCEDMLASHAAGTLEPRLSAAGLTMVEPAEAEEEDDEPDAPLPAAVRAGAWLLY